MTSTSERETEKLISMSKDRSSSNNNYKGTTEEGVEEEYYGRNTLSLSGRETDGQSAILAKCKELIERLREELLIEKQENAELKEKILDISEKLQDAKKNNIHTAEDQLFEMEEINKTILEMGHKVDVFQKEAETALQEKSQVEKKLQTAMKINQQLKDFLKEKDNLIETMKEEMDSVLLIKEEIPKLMEINQHLNGKLKERNEQMEVVMQRVKNTDTIEDEIKALQESLEEARNAILELGRVNEQLKEKIKNIEKEKEKFQKENLELRSLKNQQNEELRAFCENQEDFKNLLEQMGKDLKEAMEENNRLKNRLEERATHQASESKRSKIQSEKKDSEIRQLNKQLRILKQDNIANKATIEKLKKETEKIKNDYEIKLKERVFESTQRQLISNRLEEEIQKNMHDINQFADQCHVISFINSPLVQRSICF